MARNQSRTLSHKVWLVSFLLGGIFAGGLTLAVPRVAQADTEFPVHMEEDSGIRFSVVEIPQSFIPNTSGNTLWTSMTISSSYDTAVSSTTYKCNAGTGGADGWQNSNQNLQFYLEGDTYMLPVSQDISNFVPSHGYGYANCTGIGYYYINIWNQDTDEKAFGRVYFNGSEVVASSTATASLNYPEGIFKGTYDTRFMSLIISGTSTIDLDVEYFLEQSEIDTTIAERNPSQILYRYGKGTSTDVGISVEIDETKQGIATSTYTLSGLEDGIYTILIRFTNIQSFFGAAVPFPETYIYADFVVSGGILVSTSTSEIYTATTTSEETIIQPCGITHIDGCISNSLNFLFIPSEESVQQFDNIKQEAQQRAPLVYVYQTPDLFNSLFNSQATQTVQVSASTTIGNFTFISKDQLAAIPFSEYIKTIISALLYIMMTLHIYARVKNIFSHQDTATT